MNKNKFVQTVKKKRVLMIFISAKIETNLPPNVKNCILKKQTEYEITGNHLLHGLLMV